MRTLRILLLSLAVTAAPAAGVASIAPYLVKDINPNSSTASSAPRGFVSLGNLAFFEAREDSGKALWRSDGTAGGTYPLLRIEDTQLLALTPDRYFFLLHPPGSSGSPQLWVSDGSLPGTFQLTGEMLFGSEERGRTVWVPAQRTLYFAAEDESAGHGIELWRTDGTPGGTYEVADIWPGAEGSQPRELTKLEGKAYFAAEDPVHGLALWRSDGTAQGTVLVNDAAPRSLHVVGPRLVFVGSEPSRGSELWVSNGTARGTHPLIELVKGEGSPLFRDFVVHEQRLYFVAVTGAAKGAQLWVTDGTAKGTRPLARFTAADALVTPLPRRSPPGRMIFVADDGLHGREIWGTNGTAKGTHLVRDICQGRCGSDPDSFVLVQGKLYFRAFDNVAGTEIWVTDGSRARTRLVRDLCPGLCGTWPHNPLPLGGRLIFLTYDGSTSRIWSTDGTAAGTVLLRESEADVYRLDAARAGDMLIFAYSDFEHGDEPWCTDGTPAGTVLLTDLADEDIGGSDPGELMALGGTALFFANDGEHGYELWKSDGTAAGTALVTELLPGNSPGGRPSVGAWTATPAWLIFGFSSYQQRSAAPEPRFPPPPPHKWTRTLWATNGTPDATWRLTPDGVSFEGQLSPPVATLGSQVYFAAGDSEHGYELWVTDGTPAGTRLSADLVPGVSSSQPRDFVVFQGKLWFITSIPETYGIGQLWRSDGTAAGTVAVGPALRRMESPILHQGRLWFVAQDDEQGTGLWSTDGTDAGTALTIEMTPDWQLVDRRLFTDGARLYFSVFATAQRGLWVSDGTAAGTHRIYDQAIYPNAQKWAVSGGLVFYAAHSLVVSDGTAAGTRAVRTADGDLLDPVENLLPFGNRLLVSTSSGELWQTDGTDAGTTLVQGSVGELLRAGSRVFFPAWDAETGHELWAIQE